MIVFLVLMASATVSKIPREEDLIKDEHIEILGDQMECINDICTITNKGKDVVATHHGPDGVTKLTAKKMTISKSKEINAAGDVKILHTPVDKKKKEIRIFSKQARYLDKNIFMEGDVTIVQNGSEIKGDRGEANIETKSVKILGSKNKSASVYLVQKGRS
jgi:lipopolysaccharide export system protein LptA